MFETKKEAGTRGVGGQRSALLLPFFLRDAHAERVSLSGHAERGRSGLTPGFCCQHTVHTRAVSCMGSYAAPASRDFYFPSLPFRSLSFAPFSLWSALLEELWKLFPDERLACSNHGIPQGIPNKNRIKETRQVSRPGQRVRGGDDGKRFSLGYFFLFWLI